MEHLAKKLINWASILEPNTREQALQTASMPFIWPHLALMPDAHLGKGSTVGSVIPTRGAVIPAAVGVDIGCGMIASRTTLMAADLPDSLGPFVAELEHLFPAGLGRWHSVAKDDALSWLRRHPNPRLTRDQT